MQNQPSLCMILAIIFAWLLLKLSVTFCIHPMQRSPRGWVKPGETVRVGLLRRTTFQGLSCCLFVNLRRQAFAKISTHPAWNVLLSLNVPYGVVLGFCSRSICAAGHNTWDQGADHENLVSS